MAPARRPKGISPKLTERFLASQPEVVEAKVYWAEDDLAARIVVGDYVDWSVRTIQSLICNELGLHQVPRQIQLEIARSRAA